MKLARLTLLAPIVFAAGCQPETPVVPHEEELITTVEIAFTSTDGGVPLFWKYEDLDGDGGNEPVWTLDTLQMNTVYNAEITLWNKSETPTEELTGEILAEAQAHQFFFETDLDSVAISYNDLDVDGNPIGQKFILETASAQSGTFTLILKHEPDKFADGVANGQIGLAGGETDVEIVFDLVVQ